MRSVEVNPHGFAGVAVLQGVADEIRRDLAEPVAIPAPGQFPLGDELDCPIRMGGLVLLDDAGQPHPLIMGCYGIGVGRILIAAVESLHDDKGIVWPAAIAPYSVVITPIKYEGEMKAAADNLYAPLNAAGIDTLLDDRDARPGFKFADADLIGIPVRINVGDRGLKEGKVEVKRRKATEAENVALDNVLEAVRTALKAG